MAAVGWGRRPASVWRREQDQALAGWLRSEVVPFSQWWQERLDSVGVKSVRDLVRVPVLQEAQAAGAGGPGNPALLILPTEDGFKRYADRGDLIAAAREVGGGGTNARRAAIFRRYKPVHVHETGAAATVAVAFTRTDLDRLHLAGARLAEVLGLGADDALVSAVPAGPSLRFWGIYHLALASRMTALHPRTDGADPVRAVRRSLAMLPATVLALPAAEAEELLRGLVAAGVRVPTLRTLLVVGPPPATQQRVTLTGLALQLGAPVVRVQAAWAPDSARSLWGECRPVTADPAEATYGLHTDPQMAVVQVRDVATDILAAPNHPGEVLLTNLGWRGTALVRYATGAWTGGLVEDVACPSCGRTVPRLSPRAADAAWQPRVRDNDGRRVRVDLRPAASLFTSHQLASMGATNWSLRADGDTLVLGLDADTSQREAVVALAVAVGRAVGSVPEVRLGARAAAVRPQLGDAG